MQGKQQVEKFGKGHRVMVEATGEEATITRGKKYNKTKRGVGTYKSAFFSQKVSKTNVNAEG